MRKMLLRLSLPVMLLVTACSTPRRTVVVDDGKISVTFLQVNDVYEIAPIEGGKTGGMARVATLKKELLKKNPNTFLVMAGDFLSPSVYNSLVYEGKRIRGRQMVEAMDAAGTDVAVFGNHEFDITESELQSRMNESRFRWISSNSFHKTAKGVFPFSKTTPSGSEDIPQKIILNLRDADGTTVKLGLIGINIPFNNAPYVSYTDPMETAVNMYNQLKDSCDYIIAITHQYMQDDVLLAGKLPGLAMILGGHEHNMRYQQVGEVLITKAHANARSAYIVELNIDKLKKTKEVRASLKPIDNSVALDPSTSAVVKKWSEIAERNYASIGFDANKIVLTKGDSLEARETLIRQAPTNFSRLIVSAMEAASPAADVAILNSGSIRLDDVLHPPVSQYDILRSLPFGGGITELDMKGSLLKNILEAGRNNVGIGGFLHYSPAVIYDSISRQWNYKQQPIADETVYKVALTDFLLTGGEANMKFLTRDNPAITKVYPAFTALSDPRSDIRLAIIRYMKKLSQ